MRWAGEYRPHAHLSVRNGLNAVICALALAPTILVVRHPDVLGLHPLAAVNLLFFVNVTVGFWALGLFVQRSFWLIDPYWTILPPLIGVFYQRHPLAAPGCVHMPPHPHRTIHAVPFLSVGSVDCGRKPRTFPSKHNLHMRLRDHT